ncbi:MAG: bifunctional phosphopantothenoylcysteine decarboxylase/phosphopantothenate--cysteine ligase CoaBC [Pseudomonadota bacterium]
MSNPLAGRNVVLGITGGIAAYKTPALVRALTAAGAQVQVVMSDNAKHFVAATSLQAVSGRPVRDSLWDAAAEAAMGHIELARWADILLVAPATANAIAKLASGVADDLLSTLVLATQARPVLAPAMNQQMYAHASVARNLATLRDDGWEIAGPAAGEQACGDVGPGRMLEPEELLDHLCAAPTVSERAWQGKHVMITTGPTREAIDPVRFISNHSSGAQGLSIARAARDAGARVTLVAGPGVADSTHCHQRLDICSAMEMHAAVHEHIGGVDVFIGVAAVADYRMAQVAGQKMKRSGDPGASLQLEMVENPDIIASVAALEAGPLVVGFAAETNNTLEHARAKRVRKGLDAIVMNDVSNPEIGFNSAQNAATLIWSDGELNFEQQSKDALARALIDNLGRIFAVELAGTNPDSVTK